MNRRSPPDIAFAEAAVAIAPTGHGDLVLCPTEVGTARFNLRAEFDAKRRLAEALAADAEDIKELEAVEKRDREGERNAS